MAHGMNGYGIMVHGGVSIIAEDELYLCHLEMVPAVNKGTWLKQLNHT